MNQTLTYAQDATSTESLAFLAFPSKQSAVRVTPTTEEIARAISVYLSQLIHMMCATRTAEEFRVAREAHLKPYFQTVAALGQLICASVDPMVIAVLTSDALADLEAEFRDNGEMFSAEIREQAIFTAWTLREINGLVSECNAQRVAGHLSTADGEFARQYFGSVVYAKFHLDCLVMSLKTQTPLFPGPLDEISDGLRAAVDAYAWVRHGRDLRLPHEAEEKIDIPWDEEQDILLADSSHDLLRESY